MLEAVNPYPGNPIILEILIQTAPRTIQLSQSCSLRAHRKQVRFRRTLPTGMEEAQRNLAEIADFR